MAKNFEAQLDRFTALFTMTWARIGREVLRGATQAFILDLGPDRLRQEVMDLAESAVDDGDDEGVGELVEKPIRTKVRSEAEAAMRRLEQWASRSLSKDAPPTTVEQARAELAELAAGETRHYQLHKVFCDGRKEFCAATSLTRRHDILVDGSPELVTLMGSLAKQQQAHRLASWLADEQPRFLDDGFGTDWLWMVCDEESPQFARDPQESEVAP